MSVSADKAPTKLGRYVIQRELGKGAMGIVYEGFDPNINRRVAIKTARRDTLEKSGRADELMERFLREARACGGLNSPHIVTIYDADEEDGTAYIAMELIQGSDLQHAIKHRKRFDAKEVVSITSTICEALACAHKQGIVHRDVKPANVMMLPDGVIKVADFGIARVSDSNLTQEGSMIGTPHYMSPEQFMGHKIDGRSDLFSVGIIAYELLTGEKPFSGEALSTVMHSVLKVQPIEPSELNFAVNSCLSRVVMKALSKDPAARYADGTAMAAALRESIKPNPDPAITGVGTPSASAANLGATVASAPASDRTVLMDSNPAMRQTTARRATAPPPGSVDHSSVTQALGIGQPAPEKAKKKLPMPAIAGGALALVAVLAGTVYAMMPGGNTLKSASITIRYTEDQDMWDKYDNASPAEKATLLAERGAFQSMSGKIVYVQYDEKENATEKIATINQQGDIDFDAGTRKVTIKLNEPGYMAPDLTITAKKPDDEQTLTFLALKE